VPIRQSDADIRANGIGWLRDEAGNVMATNSFMVRHILEESKREGGWVKQPYFAVTAPDHRGYDPYLSLEGMVYRVHRDTLQDPMDVPAMERNLYQRFRFGGLFLADGSWDRRIYKDDNASTITRNYASAHTRLAFHYRDRGDLPRAIAEMERVQRMFPGLAGALIPLGGFYLERGDTARALTFFRDLVRQAPGDADVRFYLGATLGMVGDFDGALREYDEAIRLAPDFPDPYYYAYSLLGRVGQLEQAMGYLQRLVQVNPQDQEARALLRRLMSQLGATGPTPGAGGPMPAPSALP
jgi:hypothetical protein